MSRYLIYTNGNGTDAYPLSNSEDCTPEDEYKRLLEEHNDEYFETTAVYIELDGERILYVWEVFLPELEDDAVKEPA